MDAIVRSGSDIPPVYDLLLR